MVCKNRFLFKGKKLDPLIPTAKAEAVGEAFRRTKRPVQQQIERAEVGKPKQ